MINNQKPAILIVDDEPSIQESFRVILEPKYNVATASSGESALEKVAAQKIDLVFLDIRMPGIDGIETLRELKKTAPNLEVIMVTALDDIQKAAYSIRLGARDYVVKPFDVKRIQNACEDVFIKRNFFAARSDLLGNCEKIARLRKIILDVSAAGDSLLLVREIGSEGCEIAQMIHDQGEGEQGLFLAVQAADLSEFLEKENRFDGVKTFFVNNIEITSIENQQKLLAIPKSIRMIAATTADPFPEGFNQELYKKLAKHKIKIPSLRERIVDLHIIIGEYLKSAGPISDEVYDLLSVYAWPGNMEELKNVISTAVVNQKSKQIEIKDLPLYLLMQKESFKPQPFEDIYCSLEKQLISSVLKKTDGNKDSAAKLLGIKLRVLEAKLEK
ncbi:sigma-54-dependent transcriptional regulator [Candidatus Margulisiibacteriota bacterium]